MPRTKQMKIPAHATPEDFQQRVIELLHGTPARIGVIDKILAHTQTMIAAEPPLARRYAEDYWLAEVMVVAALKVIAEEMTPPRQDQARNSLIPQFEARIRSTIDV